MTRPRGTVPVRLSRHRAQAFADWVAKVQIPQGTLLSNASISERDLKHRDLRNQAALDDLKASLAIRRTGRPRASVGTYNLPVEGLLLLDDWIATWTLPRSLRPLIWQIHKRLQMRHRVLLTPQMRRKNIENGNYAPDTERKYKRMLASANQRRDSSKGRGLYGFKPDDRRERRATILNILPMIVLPQFNEP